MATTAKLKVKDQDLLGTLRNVLKSILKQDDISAVLVPWKPPTKAMAMPTLLTDADQMAYADPLGPAFPMNSAKIVSRLTRKSTGGTIVALIRPCEIRAFLELVKLKQGRTEELILISSDCLGAMGNREFAEWMKDNGDNATAVYIEQTLSGKESKAHDLKLTKACQACEFPVAENADINIGLFGMDASKEVVVQSFTEKGDHLLGLLRLPKTDAPASREKEIKRRIAEKTAFRDSMFTEVQEQIDSMDKLGAYLSNCVNCYNCRVACPVCYCRECVFVTDVFDHEPIQYLRWARRKGAVKMPTDTLLYHITRLAHMSTACVGCGQCTNACPNDIPVMDLFRTVAHKTQRAFDYLAGRSISESPPMSEFKEDEFEEVVGINT